MIPKTTIKIFIVFSFAIMFNPSLLTAQPFWSTTTLNTPTLLNSQTNNLGTSAFTTNFGLRPVNIFTHGDHIA